MSASVSKVAIVEPVGGHGGMDYYDFGLCGGLADTGVDIVLHTCDKTICPKDAAFEVRHTLRGVYGKDAAWRRGLRYVRGTLVALFSAMREGRCIVHFHLFHVGPLQTMQVLLARLLMRQVVITAHDVESFVEGLEVPMLSRWVYRLAHRVIAHNQISKKELVERLGLKPEQIAVIPMGNYLHTIRSSPTQEEARRALGIPAHAKVLLFFGQIKEVKGLDVLIEAMPGVLEQHPDTVLLIAGRPWKSDFSVYEKRMDSLGIRNRCITHIRYIPDEEVPLYYRASDVVVLPYRRVYQSAVVLMAMGYGRPVLVSDLPGMTEIVRDGGNGFVFKQSVKGDLSSRLCALLENEELLSEMALNGLEYVRLNHDWREIGIQTSRLYNTLV